MNCIGLFGNNKANVCGEIIEPFSFIHEVFGEKFYKSKLKIDRYSGVSDFIPILVCGKMIDINTDYVGRFANITGQFRSRNTLEGGHRRCELYVFAKNIEEVDAEEIKTFNQNYVCLKGAICKVPTYRETPLGRQITDLIIAVNRNFGRVDYIPCICWGTKALIASNMIVGTRIEIVGRIQSRDYTKVIDGEEHNRVAYEVSVGELN